MNHKIKAILSNGNTLIGAVRGSGGMMPANQNTLNRLVASTRQAQKGRKAFIYEPKPGCVAFYPSFCSLHEGAEKILNLANTRFELI